MARTSEQLLISEVIWVQQGTAGDLVLVERTTPATIPGSGQLFVALDGLLYYVSPAGVVTPVALGGSGVTSLNGLVGAVTLAAGSGITLTPVGNTITIASPDAGGTVTSVSVVTANGFAGTVATATTTPAITLTTTITGILQGNGTAISAAPTTGSGNVVLANSPTLITPALGTPASGVATNLTGTAAGLTAGTVTTNANLTGPITSVGNATAVAAQTGTGSVFVMQNTPTLTTPVLGVATGTSLALTNTLSLEETGVGTDTITLQAPASIAASYTLTLPVDDGTALQFLQTDGSGVLSWSAGPVGPQGNPGVNGISGAFTQAFTAQTTVNVTHNFGGYPVVQVIDTTGAVLIPLSITNNSVNDFTVVFDISTSGNIIATLGGVATAVTTITTNYSILTSDNLILGNSANITATLPTAVGNQGKSYQIKKIDTTGPSLTIATTGGQNIDGGTTVVLTIQYSSVTVYSDGTQWWII